MAPGNALRLAASFGLGVVVGRMGDPVGWLKGFLEGIILNVCSPSLRIQLLQEQLSGPVTFLGEGENQTSVYSLLYNALYQGRNARPLPKPLLLVVAANAADVEKTVQFAHQHKLKVSVRGSGHAFSGCPVQEGAIILDVSRLKTIAVDKEALTARVGAGVTGLELFTTLAMWGLHFPGPYVSHVGLSGFLLGGGIGRGFRAYGAACDSVLALEVVDGRPGESLRRVDAESEPDLFWGLRGAGAFLGVVTEFTVQLRPISASLTSRLSIHPFEAAPQIFHAWAQFNAEDHNTLDFTLLMARGPDGLPALELHVTGYGTPGTPDDQEGIARLDALTQSLPTISVTTSQAPPLELLTSADAAWLVPGIVAYVMSVYVEEVTDDVISILLSHFLRCTAPGSFIAVERSASKPKSENAFGFRDMYHIGIYALWKRSTAGSLADGDRLHAGWVQSLCTALLPHRRGCYINEFMFEPEDDVSVCYEAETWQELKRIKEVFDPKGIFRSLTWKHSASWLT
eukprot:jgi/Botrbrau1/1927/Bobra.0005s0030.2